MGRSLRRAKKSRVVVKVGVQKNKKNKAPVSVQLPGQDGETTWVQEDTPLQNYKLLNLARDPNKLFGRQGSSEAPLEDQIDFDAMKDEDFKPGDIVSADELTAACSKIRSTGKAAPKKLTSKQRGVVEKLIAKHGEDLTAMFKDRKLNAMQHTRATLEALIESYRAYPELEHGGFRGFHAPKKSLGMRGY